MGVPRTYQHPLLRALYRALLEEAEAEIHRKLEVAILVAADYPQTTIADRLGLSVRDVRTTVRELERVARHL